MEDFVNVQLQYTQGDRLSFQLGNDTPPQPPPPVIENVPTPPFLYLHVRSSALIIRFIHIWRLEMVTKHTRVPTDPLTECKEAA